MGPSPGQWGQGRAEPLGTIPGSPPAALDLGPQTRLLTTQLCPPIMPQLPHKDDAMLDAISQKGSNVLPKSKFENKRSCSSYGHTLH